MFKQRCMQRDTGEVQRDLEGKGEEATVEAQGKTTSQDSVKRNS